MSSVHDSWARQSSTPLVSAAFKGLIHAAKQLSRDISGGKCDSQYFDQVKELLATVPVSSGEHAWAVSRLGNAMQYAAAGERGGACYELRLLVRKLVKYRQTNQF